MDINWSWIITNAISALLLPPLNMIMLCALGLLLRKKWPKFSLALSVCALLVLSVISTRAGALLLIRPLEKLSAPLLSTQNTGAQAIVVLGGGRIENALEYGGLDISSALTLVRLRYAAKLYRETGLPLLVTGGAPQGASQSEAALMARSLREDFSIPVKWLEQNSDNTAQNAQYSAPLLKAAGVQRILLVTDAMHMPRAQRIFARNGLEVVPAPTQFMGREHFTVLDLVPGGLALHNAWYALHEWIGLCWYRLRHG